MEEKPKVVITNWVQPRVIERLEQSCRVVANPDREPWSNDILERHLADADAVVAFMPDRINDAVLARSARLKMVSCCLKGFDNFDVDACTRRGILVSILPDLLTAPGAELAVGLMIASGRHFLAADRHIRQGQFRGWRPLFYGTGLADSTVGILGMGAIGQSIATRLGPFQANILYWDKRRIEQSAEREMSVSYRDLDELLASADFLVLALSLTPETRHLINADRLARTKPGAILVNIARGSLVDEASVARSLKHGHLGFYAADVFEFEDWAIDGRPREIDQDLVALSDRTFFTPHLGSAVSRVRETMAMQAAENVLAFLNGQVPDGALNAGRVLDQNRENSRA